MREQKTVTLPRSGLQVTLEEMDGVTALRWVAFFAKSFAGGLKGVGDFDPRDVADVHLGAAVLGIVDRLLAEGHHTMLALLRDGVKHPEPTADWIAEIGRRDGIHDVFHLLSEVVAWNFAPAWELAQKKIPALISSLFSTGAPSDGTP